MAIRKEGVPAVGSLDETGWWLRLGRGWGKSKLLSLPNLLDLTLGVRSDPLRRRHGSWSHEVFDEFHSPIRVKNAVPLWCGRRVGKDFVGIQVPLASSANVDEPSSRIGIDQVL